MNLQEFIKNVLVEIDSAVDEARSVTKRDIRFQGGTDKRTIEFDIAVSAEVSKDARGKAGIKVLQFAEAGGDISKTEKNSTISRITFGLNINPLTKSEDKALSAEAAQHTGDMQQYFG